MKESTILKLCKRATRRNPKSVNMISHCGVSFRILKTTHGTYKVYFDGQQWKINQVKDHLVKYLLS